MAEDIKKNIEEELTYEASDDAISADSESDAAASGTDGAAVDGNSGMDKIAVLGDYDSIYGFATLGLATFPVEDAMSANRVFKMLTSGGYGIIYITEEYAALLSEQIDRFRESMLPAIIQIPGVKGNTGKGIESVHKSVEQAVGSDILFSGK